MVQMVIYRSWRPNAYYLWNYNGGTTRRVSFRRIFNWNCSLNRRNRNSSDWDIRKEMRLLPSRDRGI